MQSWLFCLFCKLAIFTRKQVNRRQQTWLLRHNLLTFCFLHRLKVTEPIEYTLVSLTYTKFSQPTTTHLHTFIASSLSNVLVILERKGRHGVICR